MKNTVASGWKTLWNSHRQTKKLLNVFQTDRKPTRHKEEEIQDPSTAGRHTNRGGNDGGGNNGGDSGGNDPSYKRPQLVGLILGPLLFLITMLFLDPSGLSYEGKAVLATTLWIATWWITEAIPIPATSLLPIVLLPITGALDGDTVVSSYGNDIIFLFLGGFFIAYAMEKWNLHKRIALFIIAVIGTSTNRIILGFMVATGFLSMWVSNTASTMMMLPIALAITYQVSEALKGEQDSEKEVKKFEKALIFGVGYAGTVGGLGTLIGTPPLSILAAQSEELFGQQISFAQWIMFGAPIVAVFLLIVWFYLTRFVYNIGFSTIPGGRDMIQSERTKLGAMKYEEKIVMAVFVFAAVMWITRSFFWQEVVGVTGLSDGGIAMIATVLLFLVPATKEQKDPRVLVWSDSREIPWGILLLFGGGLAIAAGFSNTDLATWIGNSLTVLEGVNIILVILVSATLVLFLTEITSNTATGTMIIPLVASLAIAIQVHPFALMVPCAMAANCAFMLPVGTPPNAIIFGSGKIRIIDMVKNGFFLNIFAILLITVLVYLVLPPLWGIDLTTVPEGFSNN